MQEHVVTRCAVIGCNVSYNKLITEKILLDIFNEKESIDAWIGHIDCFFNEIPQKIILGFMRENKLSFSNLYYIYKKLPPVLQGKNFRTIKCSQH